ncbi:hypothetical protein EMA8858_03656 [Emticicia aquatica]|uniref:Uncharacterized protein n=1 Tax=Emticicia aquatica TaxID=1681835 RepID=A0ABM9AU19_9BACT|nr:hypothetical protein EMA8858_03656 [Emticicia aquatica]
MPNHNWYVAEPNPVVPPLPVTVILPVVEQVGSVFARFNNGTSVVLMIVKLA